MMTLSTVAKLLYSAKQFCYSECKLFSLLCSVSLSWESFCWMPWYRHHRPGKKGWVFVSFNYLQHTLQFTKSYIYTSDFVSDIAVWLRFGREGSVRTEFIEKWICPTYNGTLHFLKWKQLLEYQHLLLLRDIWWSKLIYIYLNVGHFFNTSVN